MGNGNFSFIYNTKCSEFEDSEIHELSHSFYFSLPCFAFCVVSFNLGVSSSSQWWSQGQGEDTFADAIERVALENVRGLFAFVAILVLLLCIGWILRAICLQCAWWLGENSSVVLVLPQEYRRGTCIVEPPVRQH